MEAPNLYLARAQSNLSTSLCHAVDSSQISHLWCLHLRISEIFLRSLPRFMTLGNDRNRELFEYGQLCGVWKLQFCCHRAVKLRRNAIALPTRVTIFSLCLLSLVNTTSRYLNVSTCCSVFPLTCRIHCLGFAERHSNLGIFSADIHSGSVSRSRKPI